MQARLNVDAYDSLHERTCKKGVVATTPYLPHTAVESDPVECDHKIPHDLLDALILNSLHFGSPCKSPRREREKKMRQIRCQNISSEDLEVLHNA